MSFPLCAVGEPTLASEDASARKRGGVGPSPIHGRASEQSLLPGSEVKSASRLSSLPLSLLFINVELIYSVVPDSSVQQSDTSARAPSCVLCHRGLSPETG